MQNIRQVIEDDVSVQCIGMEASEWVLKVDAIHDSLISKKKGLRWKIRSLVGEKAKWYKEVDAGMGEA